MLRVSEVLSMSGAVGQLFSIMPMTGEMFRLRSVDLVTGSVALTVLVFAVPGKVKRLNVLSRPNTLTILSELIVNSLGVRYCLMFLGFIVIVVILLVYCH